MTQVLFYATLSLLWPPIARSPRRSNPGIIGQRQRLWIATSRWRVPAMTLVIGAAGWRAIGPFRFGHKQGQKQRKRNESFAKRNERFRDAGRKSLNSLRTPNQ